jgi:hypothetical protein
MGKPETTELSVVCGTAVVFLFISDKPDKYERCSTKIF